MSLKKLKSSKQGPRSSGRHEGPKHYSKAPLTEAVLDIRVELPSEITLHELKEVQLGQEERYPKREDSLLVFGQMSMGSEVSASAKQTPNGYRFTSQDNRQIFQARIDGFTFSRLAPYETWESFRDEARRVWELYRLIAKPKNIIRLALRYINRLDLPLPLKDFKDYLRTIPEISPNMSQGLSGYFMQLQLPQPDLEAMLVLNQTLIPPPGPNLVSVVLDFDLFCKDNVPSEDQDIWKRFETLRTRKNEVFEACITDKTRRLIT
ncbi:MAG: TIGR04255 family protein [Nitrospirales bacterium]